MSLCLFLLVALVTLVVHLPIISLSVVLFGYFLSSFARVSFINCLFLYLCDYAVLPLVRNCVPSLILYVALGLVLSLCCSFLISSYPFGLYFRFRYFFLARPNASASYTKNRVPLTLPQTRRCLCLSTASRKACANVKQCQVIENAAVFSAKMCTSVYAAAMLY